LRLFIAIRFSDEIKGILQNVIDELKAKSISGNFTRYENLHLTLAFIGETTRVSDIRRVIDSIDVTRFKMTVGGFGNFGKLYWVGIKQNRELSKLAEQLKDRLCDEGFDIDRRKFKPHITVARELFTEGDILVNVPEATMTVGRISLMKSERIGGKLVYTEVYGRDI